MAASPLPSHLAANLAAVQTTPRQSRSRASPQASPAQSMPSPRLGSPRSSSPRNHTSGVMDVDAVMRAHGGDVEKAMDHIVAERNTLQQQNSQLWKLIEKQRAQCTHLVQDNERLRSDRERANQRLISAGMDPISGASKRLPHSLSSNGLGIRGEPLPPSTMKRNHSDRDERMVAQPSASSLQVPSADSSATSSPREGHSALLPSPMADSKSRRESRMTFAPEVRSFLSLAESPRVVKHQMPPVPQRVVSAPMSSAAPDGIQANGSPGSSYSPGPSEALKGAERDPFDTASGSQHLASMAEEEETPGNGEVDLGSPSFEGPASPPVRQSSLHRQAVGREREARDETPRASIDSTPLADSTPSALASTRRSEESTQTSDESTPRQSVDRRPSVDTGLPARQARPLPRLSPALLSHTRLSIPHTTVYPNSSGRDVLCFVVAITVRPPNAAPVTWNVAKLFSAFNDLDTKIRAKSGKRSKDWKSMVAPLPEGKAWKDFAPSKIDQRKAALEAYLQSLLSAPLSDKSDLCDFLSTDPVQAKIFSSKKEGYLTKKAKSFGGWRTRYFVLDGAVLECYENRGGPIHSSIIITNAQIGRQNRASEMAEDRESRHAFLIIEQSKKGPQRHILCAESDMERDSWIDALVKHVDPDSMAPTHISSPPPPQPPTILPPSPAPPAAPQLQSGNGAIGSGLNRRRSNSRKTSKEVTVTAAQPIASMPGGSSSKFGGAPSPSMFNEMESQRVANGHNAGTSNAIPSSASGSQPSQTQHQTESTPSAPPTNPPAEAAPRSKRQSMIPSRSSASSHSLGPPPSHSAAYLSKLSSDGFNAPPGLHSAGGPSNPGSDKDRERKAKSGRFWPSFGKTSATSSEKLSTRPVFGVPLNETLAIASVANLPAIVFRCIEWLESNRAEEEEGIYRLSGSSAVIKGLKDRFDQEGDVNLLAVDAHWDPHAIAGLLKGFLRELPTSLLTRELHPRFLGVMDLIESSARVAELSRLVSELPPPNYALLRALTAHLILIVKHAQSNKMTLRNIGIVFSPTLGIPAGIFSELVSHFTAIFDDEPEADGAADDSADGHDAAGADGDAAGADGDAAGVGVGEDTVGRKRNSMLYLQGGADTLLGLGGRALDPVDDSASDISADDREDPRSADPESDNGSNFSSDNQSSASHNATPRADRTEHLHNVDRRQRTDAAGDWQNQPQVRYPESRTSLSSG